VVAVQGTGVDGRDGGALVRPSDPTTEVVEHLFLVVEHLREGFERAAADAELSAGQAKALRHLAVAGPVPMRDLASRMRCDASNITGIVDRLEARGLVERRVAAGDRRVKSLVVTAEGRRVADRMWRQVCEHAAVVLELSDEEFSALLPLLRRAGTRCAGAPGATGAACGREVAEGTAAAHGGATAPQGQRAHGAVRVTAVRATRTSPGTAARRGGAASR
jgi:DNA-binding MarR family transcriptional regulator